jgi:hypothetical protein
VIVFGCIDFNLANNGIVTHSVLLGGILGGASANSSNDSSNDLSNDLKDANRGSSTPFKNVLIVDMANMYIGWYMEKYGNHPPYMDQSSLISHYLLCAKDHYKHFQYHNKNDAVNYVIKNYRYVKAVGRSKYATTAPIMCKTDWFNINSFISANKNIMVSVAADNRVISYTKWKNPKMHYLRGRDDYLCFKLAQAYKKKYINAVIMSDDKYKDYAQFGAVPVFMVHYIRNIDGKAVENCELITPRPNRLGQLKDYNLVRITTKFKFGDPKFMKKNDYKIAKPGHVWD